MQFSVPRHFVLDIGCDEGWFAREFATRNIRVVGVDLVPELIDATQRSIFARYTTRKLLLENSVHWLL